ncbi:hypothetical protein [Microbacterium sp. P05]|uniref:hypothetical protein n=1 Tax=Microbacterium sp. P05 TaxID=3366948 RepID=UPI0037450D68
MKTRLIVAVALAGLIGLMSGCVGEPTPTETTPAFSSEEEAYAAAEETYRAYVDALNQVDLSDPETFEPVFALTTGDANASARKTFSQMNADGWIVSGVSRYDNFTPASFDPGVGVKVDLCLDVTEVEVTDSTGTSMVGPDRLDRQPVRVTFSEGTLPGTLVIQASEASEGGVCTL